MMNSNKQLIAPSTALFLVLASPVWTGDVQAQYQPPAQQQGQRPEGASISVQQPAPQISVQQPAPQVQVQQPQPQISVQQPAPKVQVQQPQPQVTVQQPQPKVTVQQPQPQVTVQQPQPKVTVQQPPPQVTVQQPRPEVTVQQPRPEVTVQQAKPEVTVQQPKPEVTVQQQGQPEVIMRQQGQPQVTVQEQGKPQVTVQEQGKPQVQVQQQGQPQVQVQEQQGQAQVDIQRQATGQSMMGIPQAGWRSTQLTGREVRTPQGEDVGDIHDFIIRKDGQVSQVILNLEDRKVTVPFERLQVTGPDTLIYQGTRQQLAQLPTYQEGQGAGEESVPPLVGRDVRNAQNQQIGEVDDLIIGPDGRVGIVLSVGGFLGVGDRLVAVPLHAVQVTGQDYVLYEGTREQLAQMPEFNYDQLQRGLGGAEQPAQERRREGVVQ